MYLPEISLSAENKEKESTNNSAPIGISWQQLRNLHIHVLGASQITFVFINLVEAQQNGKESWITWNLFLQENKPLVTTGK
jgi:hypothetical protein